MKGVVQAEHKFVQIYQQNLLNTKQEKHYQGKWSWQST